MLSNVISLLLDFSECIGVYVKLFPSFFFIFYISFFFGFWGFSKLISCFCLITKPLLLHQLFRLYVFVCPRERGRFSCNSLKVWIIYHACVKNPQYSNLLFVFCEKYEMLLFLWLFTYLYLFPFSYLKAIATMKGEKFCVCVRVCVCGGWGVGGGYMILQKYSKNHLWEKCV